MLTGRPLSRLRNQEERSRLHWAAFVREEGKRMGLYAKTETTFRVEFDDRGWVELREEITAADRKIALNAANRLTSAQVPKKGRKRPERVETTFNDQAYAIALLHEMIVGWSEDDEPTRENIQKLPQWMVDKLIEELDAHNGGSDEEDAEEREGKESASTPPSETDDGGSEPPGPLS